MKLVVFLFDGFVFDLVSEFPHISPESSSSVTRSSQHTGAECEEDETDVFNGGH